MSACDIETKHMEALRNIQVVTNKFYEYFNSNKEEILSNCGVKLSDMEPSDIDRVMKCIVYPPVDLSADRERFTHNKIKYFSDHLPITKEYDNTIIITWNIAIGSNNSPCMYEKLKDIIKRCTETFKTNVAFRDVMIQRLIDIIIIYVTEMEKCRKPIVLHLQECSYDVYTKLQQKLTGKKFTSKFMPQVIAKVRGNADDNKVKLYYIEEKLTTYRNNELTLGLCTFIFADRRTTINLKIYPTSAKLFKKKEDDTKEKEDDTKEKEDETKEKYDLYLESRINLVDMTINGTKLLHYNLHLKKENSRVLYDKCAGILKLYSDTNFVDIIDDTKGTVNDLKKLLIDEIRRDISSDNIIKIEDGELHFKDTELITTYTSGARYMCGDFNYNLSRLSGLPVNIIIDRDGDKVDFIVKINRGVAAARSSGVDAASWRTSDKSSGFDASKKSRFNRHKNPGSDAPSWRQKYLKYKAKYLKLKAMYDNTNL
jgi:hypothetical protein